MDVSEEPADLTFKMQGGDIIFLRNAYAYLQNYTKSHLKKHHCVK